MNKIISKVIKIKSDNMPPEVDFIEKEIRKNNIEPLRWAIVEINNNELTLCASGEETE